MKIRRRHIVQLILCATTVALVGGCAESGSVTADKLIARTPLGQYLGKGTNIRENSYAVADYLVHQLQQQYVKSYAGIEIIPLYNVDSPTLSAPFDSNIPKLIGERFKALGYDADLSAVDDKIQAPAITRRAQYKMSGHYSKGPQYYEINLTITQRSNQKQIAAFNYHIPRSWGVDKMTKPDARIEIIRTSP